MKLKMTTKMNDIIIKMICPDQQGIIAQLTSILFNANINILSIEQHVNNEKKQFYIRVRANIESSKLTLDQLKNEVTILNFENIITFWSKPYSGLYMPVSYNIRQRPSKLHRFLPQNMFLNFTG